MLYQRGCLYLNYEEDAGIPGLRRAKLAYRPINILKKYKVRAGPADRPDMDSGYSSEQPAGEAYRWAATSQSQRVMSTSTNHST